ncbi:MAG: hypothetical protein J6L85_02555 [Clostridia bacterium]|nr:hypothetical protein [Clostridia bacterium]
MKKAPKRKHTKKNGTVVVAIILSAVLALIIGGVTVSILMPILNGSEDENLSYEDAHAKIPGHGFLDAYQTDANSHWRICKHKTCTDIIDKGDHEWDEGTVISEPTDTTAGQTKYVCTVCGRSKVQTISANNGSSSIPTPDDNNNSTTPEPSISWPEEIKLSDFENFSFSQSVTSPYEHDGDEKLERIDSSVMLFTKEKASLNTQYQITNGDVGSGEQKEYTGDDIAAKRKEITDVVFAILADKDKFITPEDDGDIVKPDHNFVATESMTVLVKLLNAEKEITLENIAVDFYDSRLSEISFEYADGEVRKQVTWSFYHYGETSFDPLTNPNESDDNS